MASSSCEAIPCDDQDLVGIQDRLQALKSLLAIDSQGVLTVGIWGLGGGGKTALAYAIYDEIWGKFDGCCFLENVREKSSKHGLKKLQKEILSCLLKQKKEELHGDVRLLIKSRLRRKKVLLVLDDVDNLDQLEALAGSQNWFKEGSRVIITTRDQHLLNYQQVNAIYEVSLLNDDEAMKLFCKHALRRGDRIEDFYSLSNKVVSFAGGLPLALKAMGSFLCDKDRSEWVSALANLKDIPEYNNIMETLKISYNGLNPLEKNLFLEIACFFRRIMYVDYKPWDILEACGPPHPKVVVMTLIEKALITVSKDGRFDMHDLIQEMGHYIVRGENPRNPEKHSRVWRPEDVRNICSRRMEENHWIEALQVLPGWSIPRNLPHVVANLKKLRWLSCYKFPATSLATNFQPQDLYYLGLPWSSLEQLWEGYKILPNLRALDLSWSQELISTPDFQGLPLLERIKLNGCKQLTYIHPSISDHENLVSVEMKECTSLETFPPISGMKKLEILILSKCVELCNFPEIQRNMDNMVQLSLSETKIKVVPSSIAQHCTNLVSLDLECCGSLESIEGNFHLLRHLKELNLNWCQELNFHWVRELYDTSFEDLPQCKKLFPPSLRKLSFGCNRKKEDVSYVLWELSNLQQLDPSYNEFSRLRCSLLQLRSLKVFILSSCKELVELPDLPGNIAVLQAHDCDELKIVDLPTNLRWLWRISLPLESISGDVGRKVQSMIQGNAIKDYSMSIAFYGLDDMPIRDTSRTLMLELPRNWYDEFSGFLIRIKLDQITGSTIGVITIKDVMNKESEDVLEVSDGTPGHHFNSISYIYVSFDSLRHTSWWNSKHTTVSFSIDGTHTNIDVELVPGRSKGDSIERVKDTTSSSKFWDKEPIKVKRDSESCIEIQWDHGDKNMWKMSPSGDVF